MNTKCETPSDKMLRSFHGHGTTAATSVAGADACFTCCTQAALDDPRFSGLVRDAAFALDPTDPRFKQAEGAAELAAAVAKRKTGRTGVAGAASEPAGGHAGPGQAPAHAATAKDGAGARSSHAFRSC